ncbi:MAG: riboflavin synthase [Microbacteriaceae bacterium]|nr:riboflavin synthase [Microbacteriaceae bacterium]
MFTGLIEEIGEIVAVAPSGDGACVTVHAPGVVADATHGASIAVGGVCLTVVSWDAESFDAEVMRETLDVTTIGARAPGDRVNVERALRADARLGGHIVQGHVDDTSEVLEVRPGDQWRVIRFALDPEHAPLVVKKGSITVDGVSLTVSDVSAADAADAWFEVSLIPETLAATTLGALAPGDRVNIETDILARHVARLIAFQAFEPDAPDAFPRHAADA